MSTQDQHQLQNCINEINALKSQVAKLDKLKQTIQQRILDAIPIECYVDIHKNIPNSTESHLYANVFLHDVYYDENDDLIYVFDSTEYTLYPVEEKAQDIIVIYKP